MYNSGNARLFYLLLIVIGSSSIGFGIHSASAETPSPNCNAIPGPGVNYNDCNLTSRDFSGSSTVLSGATFIGATLDGAKFSSASLDGANFTRANNHNVPVDFTNTNLSSADFRWANLRGSTFVGANIDAGTYNFANLVTANFTRADSASDTIFNNANLTRATFAYANPTQGLIEFQNTDLHYVDFTGADLVGSGLTSRTDLSGAKFYGANVSLVDFTLSIMHSVIFSSTTNAHGANFNGADLSHASLIRVNFSGDSFKGVSFVGANLTGSSMANTKLGNSTFVVSGLIIPPTFNVADLSYVDFTGAVIDKHADFTGAITTGTVFACGAPITNPICATSSNPPPVIHFDLLSFTGGSSLVQVNSTAWKISAASSAGTNVQYTGVYATINGNKIPSSNVICTPPSSPPIFPLGSNKVICTATDPANSANTSTAYFYIIIVNNTPPIVTPSSNPVIAEATGPLTNVFFHVTAYDVVDGNIPVTGCNPGNGTQFALGSTPVTCTATDSGGNTGSTTFSVIIQDTTPPKLTTGNQTVEATGPGGSTVVYHATAIDIVDGHVTPICTPALNGTQFALGSTTLTCTATDSHSNTSTKPLTITVRDTTPPKIISPSNISMPATGTLTQVTLGTPTVSDTVDPNPTVTNNAPAAGFPVGTTIVIWTATDHSGNSATATQTVIITSNVPVTITAPPSITTQATGALTQVALGTPTFTDPLDPNPTVTNNAPVGGFPVAMTTVTWHLVDKYGNTANSQQAVTVQDTIPPTITAANPQYVQATGPLGAIVNYHATATDLVDGKVTPICTPLNGTQFALGSTPVTCTATDSHHNISTQTFAVIVQDTTGPVMTLTPNPVIVEAVNQNGALVTFNVTATDVVTGHASASCTPSSGTIFGLGQNIVVCTATDKATPPNTSTVSYTITVRDTTPPTITAPPSITKVATGTLTQVTLGTPTVSDTVDPNPTVTNNAPAAGFLVGTTIVTWTATDHAGNSKTATQTVIILPINTPGKVNGEGSFGKETEFNMNIQSKDGLIFKGHLDYSDELAKIDLESQTITSLFVDSTVTKANYTGTAKLNDHSGYTFKAYVIDNGNPGKNDFFQIAIFDSNGNQVYVNSGKLVHGNLHVSNKADSGDDSRDHDPRDKWNNDNKSSK